MAVQSKLVLATKAARPFFLAVTRFGTCVVNYTDNPSVLDLRTRLPRQTAHEIKGTSIVNPAVNGGGNAAATLLGHDPGHFAPAACSHGCLVPKNSSNRHQPGPCIQPKHRITFQSTSFTTLKQLRAQSKHFKHLHTTLTANGGAVTTNNGISSGDQRNIARLPRPFFHSFLRISPGVQAQLRCFTGTLSTH